MTFEFSPLLERALRFSSVSHRDQFRKGGEIPYITHPFAVALILKEHGIVEETAIAAALLHDVIEDTDCSIEELQKEFPGEVVEIVSRMTERKLDEEGRKRSWHDRKQEHVRTIANAGRLSRTVFLADKLHNLSTMVYDIDRGEEIWHRFGLSAVRLIESYREFLRQIHCENEPMQSLAEKCFRLLEQLEEKARSFEKA